MGLEPPGAGLCRYGAVRHPLWRSGAGRASGGAARGREETSGAAAGLEGIREAWVKSSPAWTAGLQMTPMPEIGPGKHEGSGQPMASPPDLESRFLGCLLGCAVGDALGAPFEGYWGHLLPAPDTLLEDFAEFEGYPRGQYTDDTQLT